jgi:hypothetical protein
MSSDQARSGVLDAASVQRLRFCEAIGLLPSDFDFEAGVLEVARSVVKVSRQHHPQGKTFLVRDYTKNRQTRRLNGGAVVELVRGHVAEHGIGATEVMFPVELVVPPRCTKARLTEEELRALGDCEPVGAKVYAHGTLGGYVQAKCRCAGCGQWAREYGRERMLSPLTTWRDDARSCEMSIFFSRISMHCMACSFTAG